MFALTTRDDGPFTRSYAETRARWEPLYEVTQIKGDGETHPILSPGDEFADYETWQGSTPRDSIAQKQAEYARSALKLGLGQQAALGANPFKFGMIGSTDATPRWRPSMKTTSGARCHSTNPVGFDLRGSGT